MPKVLWLKKKKTHEEQSLKSEGCIERNNAKS